MGLPAAGKSTLAARFVEDGYARLNRDEQGGRLADLVPELERAIVAGTRRFVLDNTYATRKSRAPLVELAARHGLRTRCVWLHTRIEDAQVNAVTRMLRRYGRLLGPEEMRAASRSDPGAFPPGVLFRYERALEPPDAAEGFSAIEEVPFRRRSGRIFRESRARRLARRRRVAEPLGSARAHLAGGRRAPAGTRAAAAPRGREASCSSA